MSPMRRFQFARGPCRRSPQSTEPRQLAAWGAPGDPRYRRESRRAASLVDRSLGPRFYATACVAAQPQICCAAYGNLRQLSIYASDHRSHEAHMPEPTLSLMARTGLDQNRAEALLKRGLEGADDGELFLEYRQSEALVFDNGRLKQATYDTAQGFGLRAVKGEAVGYAHASDVSEEAIS